MKSFNFWLTEAEQNLAKIQKESEDPDISKTKEILKVGYSLL